MNMEQKPQLPNKSHIEKPIDGTQYSEIGLIRLFYKDPNTKELIAKLQESFKKYPVYDLGCGGDGRTVRILFKDLFDKTFSGDASARNKYLDRNINLPNLKEQFESQGLLTPKEYIGIDKYNVETKTVDNRIRFVQSDLIDFLKEENTKGNKGNIIIGGVGIDIIQPHDFNNDEYRYTLLSQMANVVPIGGYLLESNSSLKFKYKGEVYSPEKFGFETVFSDPEMLSIYQKKAQ